MCTGVVTGEAMLVRRSSVDPHKIQAVVPVGQILLQQLKGHGGARISLYGLTGPILAVLWYWNPSLLRPVLGLVSSFSSSSGNQDDDA